MKSTIYNPKQLLRFIILHLGVNVHQCHEIVRFQWFRKMKLGMTVTFL